MKVQEKGTDRKAEVHLHVQEEIHDLYEYGQYIDPVDGAICCYVGVEEGNLIKIVGKFHGTTLSVAYDTIIDGILRKAQNSASKTVKVQKLIKLDCDKALVQLDDEKFLDAELKVVPAAGVAFTKDEAGNETVGTMEVHVYVMRTFADECLLGKDVPTYLSEVELEDKEFRDKKEATYKTITPELMIGFDKDVQEMGTADVNRWRKKLHIKRPGNEPWAIFRFHYRSKDTIIDSEMDENYNPKKKGKKVSEPHWLQIEAVPELIVGATKPGNDGTSTRTSSPPLDTKGTHMSPTATRQSTPVSAKGKLPSTSMSATVKRPSSLSPFLQSRPTVDEGEKKKKAANSEALVRAECVVKSEETGGKDAEIAKEPVEKTNDTPKDVEDTCEQSKPIEEADEEPQPIEEALEAPRPSGESLEEPKPAEKVREEPKVVDEVREESKPIEESHEEPKPIKEAREELKDVKMDLEQSERVEETEEQPKSVEKSEEQPKPVEEPKEQVKPFEDIQKRSKPVENIEEPTKPVEEIPATPAPTPVKPFFTTAVNEEPIPTSSTEPTNPSIFTNPTDPPIPSTPTSPAKRSSTFPPSPTPSPKRPKLASTTAPPSLFSTRKALLFMRARRTATAKKRAEIEAQLAPYREAMRREQERLERELEEERRLYEEEEAGVEEGRRILVEFMGMGGDE